MVILRGRMIDPHRYMFNEKRSETLWLKKFPSGQKTVGAEEKKIAKALSSGGGLPCLGGLDKSSS